MAAWWWWLGLVGVVLMFGSLLVLLACVLRAPMDTELWEGGEYGGEDGRYPRGAP